MAIIIRNKEGYHIAHDKDGNLIKVKNIADAENFHTLEQAIHQIRENSFKTKGYYVYDTCTHKICWGGRQVYNQYKKPKRKTYSKTVRRMLYHQADGHCQLCGRKILLEDATLDHIIPLSLGGEDCVENLQIACGICNRAKASYLPDDFQDRVFDTLCFNMRKKYGTSLKWKLTYRLLLSLQ